MRIDIHGVDLVCDISTARIEPEGLGYQEFKTTVEYEITSVEANQNHIIFLVAYLSVMWANVRRLRGSAYVMLAPSSPP